MNQLLEKIRDAGARAWLRFVQALNWIAGSLLGAAVIVQSTYPGVISDAVGKLPPLLGIPAILIFCVLVHYGIRQAKRSV